MKKYNVVFCMRDNCWTGIEGLSFEKCIEFRKKLVSLHQNKEHCIGFYIVPFS
ncbi:hypothetical protein ACYSNR_13725 [Enterococcus sp. LJL128]